MKREYNSSDVIHLPNGMVLEKSVGQFTPSVVDSFCPDLIGGLHTGEVSAIQIKGAVDEGWCNSVTKNFKAHPMTKKETVEPPIYSLGSHLYACGSNTAIECYFNTLDETNNAMEEILPDRRDPLIEILQSYCRAMEVPLEFLSYDNVEVMHGNLRLWGESDLCKTGEGKSYFALPHEDYEETNADHYMLGQIHGVDNVYSIILCIDAVPGKEPETVLWDGRLSLEQVKDPKNKHPQGSYGFDENLLIDFNVTSIIMEKGDIAIIPAHNIHAVVGEVGRKRCSYMGFFHFKNDNEGRLEKLVFRT